MMSKIKKWLLQSGIAFEEINGRIIIMLEAGCTWINGFGEQMMYDRAISIYKNTYGKYIAVETTGYSMSHRLVWSTKQDTVIQCLQERLKEVEECGTM